MDRSRIAREAFRRGERDRSRYQVDRPLAFARYYQRIPGICRAHNLYRRRIYRISGHIIGQHIYRYRFPCRIARAAVIARNRYVIDRDRRLVRGQTRRIIHCIADRGRIQREARLRRKGHIAQRINRPLALSCYHVARLDTRR